MSSIIQTGDCRELMATMEPESIDAIVCDPPYGLGFEGFAFVGIEQNAEYADIAERRISYVERMGRQQAIAGLDAS